MIGKRNYPVVFAARNSGLPMRFSEYRPLALALLFSLLIHLFAGISVDGWVPWSSSLRSKASISAVLVPVAPVAEDVSAVDEENTVRVPLPPKPSPGLVESLARRKAVARSAAKPDRSHARPDASTAQAVATEQTLAGHRPGAAARNSESEGLGFDEVAEYRVELARAIKRFEDRSLAPMKLQQELVVRIDLLVSAFSSRPEAKLVESSGSSRIDEHALTLTAKALQATKLPEGLRGKAFRVPFVLRYGIADAQ